MPNSALDKSYQFKKFCSVHAETIERIRAATKAAMMRPDVSEKVKAAPRGKLHTEETKVGAVPREESVCVSSDAHQRNTDRAADSLASNILQLLCPCMASTLQLTHPLPPTHPPTLGPPT